MNFKTVLSAASLALVFASGAQAVGNLVLNPSFESPNIGMPVDGYMYTSSVADWTTVSVLGTVLFNSTYRAPSHLLQAVQIERNGDMLSQSFATVLGQQYALSFDFSTWWLSDPTKLSTLLVQAGTLSQTITGTGPLYTPQNFTFNALSSLTTLSFTNTGPTFESYPQIDNVTVVPEPGTYALMLAGLAAVGFLAKRRSA